MTVNSIIRSKGTATPTIGSDATVRDVLQKLEEEDVGALVVSDDGKKIVGIVSERDIIRGLRVIGDDVLDAHISDVMTKDVITCSLEDRVAAVSAMMLTNGVRHIPVVNKGELAGFIGIRDILKRRLDEVQSDAEAMLKYIQS